MKKKRKKNNYNLFYIGLISGISLIVFIGILLAGLILSNDNAYFARIRVAIKKKVQIVYNHNLFDGSVINNSGIKEYDSDKQEITFDGKLEGNHINLGKLNVKLKKGERYRVTVNYLSGSYDKNGEPNFIFELQKDNEYYTDRKNGTHYVFEVLPTKKDTPIDKVLTIKDEVLDATNIIYRIYQENEVEFKNYKIQVLITKLESKIGVAGDIYGSLPTPEKEGYEFLGWYDSISGGKKVTETNTILKKYNHPLYAHWKRAIHPYRTVNYNNFKWTYYKKKTGPVSEIYDEVTPYAIWAPNDVKDLKGVSLPLIVWLHGAGEQSGNSSDESRLLNSGLLKVMSDWNTFNLEAFPAIIVAPQSSTNTWNNTINNNSVRALIKYATDNYKIDTNKIVFIGHSMGGYGVIELSWEMKDIQFYSIVIMSANRSSYKSGSGGFEFYSKQKLRGYSENTQLKDFFTWVNKQNDFTYYRGEQHGRVPMRALTEDLDGNKISDLVEWLFYKN